MKRFLPLLALLLLSVAGCQTDTTLDNTIGGGDHLLSLSITPTRTSIGEKVGDSYPAYWSKGDKVAVNGVCSAEAIIDEAKPSQAGFVVEPTPSYPYNITYPYAASSTAEQPVVVFPAEQEYTEGSFAVGSAPMCGYVEEGSAAALSHLASILRFPIKAKREGTLLKRIVVSADAPISGEFAVDCKSGEIVATEQSECSITYLLPSNFELSTSEEQILYISLAAVEVGECTIEFVASSGEKMTAKWAPSNTLAKGVVREFKSILYSPNTAITLQPLVAEEDDDSMTIFYKNISGYVRYADGSPIAGVAVSDGFQVVQTDANGHYKMSGVTPQTWYIYCSLPSDVAVPINDYGQPCFFKKYPSNSAQYDFTFEKLPGGAEKEFFLFGLADTQPSNTSLIERFSVQAAPEIKSYSRSLELPCYGIVLGDMVGSVPSFMPRMREELACDRVGMPMFACYGNHDHIACDENNPAFTDERNATFNIKIQRDFEECFGPVNYSFNRGDMHIISMRNVRNKSQTSVSSYSTAFTTEQFEWLQQDLALVPKDKMVVLCVHIPMFNSGTVGDGTYRQEVLNMLDEYAEAHILSGHTHYMHPYDHEWYNTGHKIYEHCISSTRQDMLECNIHRDGSPCGYSVFKVRDNAFVDWYYKGYAYGMNSRDDQMRLYRGASIFGAEPSGSNRYGTKGFYQLPFDNATLLANIFSSDPSWKVVVYEDGLYSGTMTHFYNISGSEYADLQGDGTYENPRRVTDGLVCSRDFWAISILFGYLGSNIGNNYNQSYTMWRYTLKNPNASHIEVRATDRFGYEYRCDRIENNSDLGYTMYDPQYNPTIE